MCWSYSDSLPIRVTCICWREETATLDRCLVKSRAQVRLRSVWACLEGLVVHRLHPECLSWSCKPSHIWGVYYPVHDFLCLCVLCFLWRQRSVPGAQNLASNISTRTPPPQWGVWLGRKGQRRVPCACSTVETKRVLMSRHVPCPQAMFRDRTSPPQWRVRLGRKWEKEESTDILVVIQSPQAISLPAPLLPNGEFGWGGKGRGRWLRCACFQIQTKTLLVIQSRKQCLLPAPLLPSGVFGWGGMGTGGWRRCAYFQVETKTHWWSSRAHKQCHLSASFPHPPWGVRLGRKKPEAQK